MDCFSPASGSLDADFKLTGGLVPECFRKRDIFAKNLSLIGKKFDGSNNSLEAGFRGFI